MLQAGWSVGRWGEAVGSGLEGGRRLVADALRPFPALHGQAAPTGLVAVHPTGCRRRRGGGARRGGEEGRDMR